jgi:hypothetical protein
VLTSSLTFSYWGLGTAPWLTVAPTTPAVGPQHRRHQAQSLRELNVGFLLRLAAPLMRVHRAATGVLVAELAPLLSTFDPKAPFYGQDYTGQALTDALIRTKCWLALVHLTASVMHRLHNSCLAAPARWLPYSRHSSGASRCRCGSCSRHASKRAEPGPCRRRNRDFVCSSSRTPTLPAGPKLLYCGTMTPPEGTICSTCSCFAASSPPFLGGRACRATSSPASFAFSCGERSPHFTHIVYNVWHASTFTIDHVVNGTAFLP